MAIFLYYIIALSSSIVAGLSLGGKKWTGFFVCLIIFGITQYKIKKTGDFEKENLERNLEEHEEFLFHLRSYIFPSLMKELLKIMVTYLNNVLNDKSIRANIMFPDKNNCLHIVWSYGMDNDKDKKLVFESGEGVAGALFVSDVADDAIVNNIKAIPQTIYNQDKIDLLPLELTSIYSVKLSYCCLETSRSLKIGVLNFDSKIESAFSDVSLRQAFLNTYYDLVATCVFTSKTIGCTPDYYLKGVSK